MPSKNGKSTAVIRVTAPRTQNKKAQKKPKVAGRSLVGRLRPGTVSVQSYINTLIDPFTCSAPRLGWGCLMPTQMGSAKARGSLICNADGSASVIFELTPNSITNVSASPIRYNVSAVGAPAVYTGGIASSNAATATASVANLRVVSAGIRFFAQVPDTAVQPVVDFGNVPRPNSTTAMEALTTAQLSNTSHLERTVTRDNSWTVTWRPMDPYDYTFNPRSATALLGSLPTITFQNLPGSSNILYEYVVHYEYYSAIENGTDVADISLDPMTEPRVSDAGTIEQVFSMMPQRVLAATQQYVGPFAQALAGAMNRVAAAPLNSFSDSLYGVAGAASLVGASYGTRNLLRLRA